MIQQFHFQVYTQKNRNQRHLYTQVHYSAIHNGQKVEATLASISRWINKQIVMYPYHGMLFNLKKEGKLANCYNMNESEEIMLGERSQTQKNKCYMIPLFWGT